MRSNSHTVSKEDSERARLHQHQGLSLVPRESGVYSIGIQLNTPIEVNIRTIPHTLEVGTYSYTGSALGRSNNLRARILRHLSVEKKVHWHIDQITNSKHATVPFVVFSRTSQREECKVNQSIAEIAQSRVPVPGFGSSDCRSGCESHLLFLGDGEIVPIVVKAFKNQGLIPKVLEVKRQKGQTEKLILRSTS
ncbi:MAG: GIY-YIG nuclease family protein [Candidatus Bathyarchaeota archaeon]|nr:MAG: GIY-YIG nuclease family protein [Candidatus Bathyarchaeota archaeon]